MVTRTVVAFCAGWLWALCLCFMIQWFAPEQFVFGTVVAVTAGAGVAFLAALAGLYNAGDPK